MLEASSFDDAYSKAEKYMIEKDTTKYTKHGVSQWDWGKT